MALFLAACGSESSEAENTNQLSNKQPPNKPPLVAQSTAIENKQTQQPEMASGLQAREGWTYTKQAVAAANPVAAEAGQSMLAAGGNALDAAIAVQLVLNLVEPQSSGIGGGAFLLSW